MLIYIILICIIIYILLMIKECFWPGYDKRQPQRISFQFPFIGTGYKVINNDKLLELNFENHKNKAQVYYSKIFHHNIVFTSNNQDIKHVLKTNFQNYIKGNTMQSVFKPLFGEGIFAVNDEKWKHQRNLAQTLFHNHSLEALIPMIYEHINKLEKILENYALLETDFDLQDLFLRFTMDTIGKFAFGIDFNTLEQNNLTTLNKYRAFSNAFNYCQAEVDARAINPFRFLFTWRKYRKNLKIINDFVYDLLKKNKGP